MEKEIDALGNELTTDPIYSARIKILLADDNPVYSRLLESNMRRWKFEPVICSDGSEVLKQMEGPHAPRLVVIECEIPIVDGVELCRQIKASANLPYTYVVLLSCRDTKQDILTGLRAGADEYLTKPVDLEILKSKLTHARRLLVAIPPKEWARPHVEGYDVDRVIGKGAFATVWRATKISTGKAAALKVLRVDLATDAVFERFAREIRIMQQLDHRYIANIYESRIDREIGYYVMDLIEGGTLGHFAHQRRLNPKQIIRLVSRVCKGLAHAHDRGVIHRDLKPSNIMVTNEGIPKIVDFGLSKSMFSLSDKSARQTMDGSLVGTPMFMAPEQARGEVHKIDHRTDIFAAGLILYLLLLRKHPFKIDPGDPARTVHELVHGSPRPPTEINPDFSPSLERILMRSLAICPEERYQSAMEFALDLKSLIRKSHVEPVLRSHLPTDQGRK